MEPVTRFKNAFIIDKNQQIISFAQTIPGKIVIISLFALMLKLVSGTWEPYIAVITAISFCPKMRRFWLFLGMLYLLIAGSYFNGWDDWQQLVKLVNDHQYLPHPSITNLRIIAITLTVVCTEIFIFLTYRYKQAKILQRPIRNLFIIIFTLLTIASYVPSTFTKKAYLWAFIIVFTHYFWYIAYTLLECKTFTGQDFVFEYARYWPIWGGSNTPFPKGATYLQKITAKNPQEFAITQLKGIKLMYWAAIVYYAYKFLLFLSAYFHIPTMSFAIHYYAANQHYSWGLAWLCLITNFFSVLLYLTVWGHIIIAMCRMCGYRALRNTYKPLQATTIAEFWDRYYYYFKELLVTFFFYPTYFRYFKSTPKFRIFFATLSAATLGVILYHFLNNLRYVMQYGLIKAIIAMNVFMIYAVILGVGIGCSQLRNLGKPPATTGWNKNIIAPIITIGFYLLLSILELPYQSTNIMPNLKFLFSLINITW